MHKLTVLVIDPPDLPLVPVFIQGSLVSLYHFPPPHPPTDVLCVDFLESAEGVVVADCQPSIKCRSHFTARAASSLALGKGLIRWLEGGVHLLSLTSDRVEMLGWKKAGADTESRNRGKENRLWGSWIGEMGDLLNVVCGYLEAVHADGSN